MLFVGFQLLIRTIEWASEAVIPVPAVLVSLLLVPVVSNLPEYVDGVIGVSQSKDSLAVEQLTGTLAFQGTVAVLIGILCAPWELTPAWGTVDFLIILAAVIALLSGGILYARLASAPDRPLSPRAFLRLGLFYLVFAGLLGYYLIAGFL